MLDGQARELYTVWAIRSELEKHLLEVLIMMLLPSGEY